MQPPKRLSAARQRPATDPDDAIRLTDDDAASSRLSAVSLGYLTDPFLPLIYKIPYLPSSAQAGPSRKPPLINVGTHHRTYGIDLLVDRFIEECEKEGKEAQVVSLGAGSDTRFWRLMSRNPRPRIRHYAELDFPMATSTKAQRIARSPKLHNALSSHSTPSASSDAAAGTPTNATSRPFTVQSGGTALLSSNYSLLPIDLRTPGALEVLNDALDPNVPTLILAECVLCYMHPSQSDEVIKWTGRFNDCALVVYEMVGLNDAFGQVMRRNLASRNLQLPGAVHSGPRDMADRYTRAELGDGAFSKAGAKTLWDVRNVVPADELKRISQLEHLDEIEELRLVLSHYCIAWASRGDYLSGVCL